MMENKIVAYDRRKQILELLATHGPLSSRALSVLIEPKMDRRRLRDALDRLFKRHILYKRLPSVSRGMPYYQIDRHEPARRRAAKILGIDSPDSLRQPRTRFVAPWEYELLTLWKVRLMRLFPGGTILRRNEIEHHPEIRALLPPFGKGHEYLPHLLLLTPRDEAGRRLVVAIEYEEWTLGPERLERKMLQYVRRSRLDGVLLLTDLSAIPRWIETIYLSEQLRSGRRIKHHQDFFWMFSDDLFPSRLEDVRINSIQLKCTNLRDWLRILRAVQECTPSEFENQKKEGTTAEVENESLSTHQTEKTESIPSDESHRPPQMPLFASVTTPTQHRVEVVTAVGANAAGGRNKKKGGQS